MFKEWAQGCENSLPVARDRVPGDDIEASLSSSAHGRGRISSGKKQYPLPHTEYLKAIRQRCDCEAFGIFGQTVDGRREGFGEGRQLPLLHGRSTLAVLFPARRIPHYSVNVSPVRCKEHLLLQPSKEVLS